MSWMQGIWEDFANAIILQAVEDYRRARRKIRLFPKTRKETMARIREVESFIGSWWYYQLTDVDGEKLMAELKQEVVR